jgi:hypothetical protein
MAQNNTQIDHEIKETLAVLSTTPSGWALELNLISWDHREPKLDLRKWSDDHLRMSKGITLTNDEAKKLLEALKSADLS